MWVVLSVVVGAAAVVGVVDAVVDVGGGVVGIVVIVVAGVAVICVGGVIGDGCTSC